MAAVKASNNGHLTVSESGAGIVGRPDPQVHVGEPRRRFTTDYKLRVLREADACIHHGDLGELLRREGLYSSTVASFRKQYESGRLSGPSPAARKEERKVKEAARQSNNRYVTRLELENKKLRALLDLQKKLSELIGIPLLTAESE